MGQTQSNLPDYNPEDFRNDEDLNLIPFAYPNGGNYTLEQCPLRELAAKSMQEQMRFSDAITRKYALNAKFHEIQRDSCSGVSAMSAQNILNKFNETSIGNMAFMAHHNPNSVWSQVYEDVIAKLTSA